MIPGVFGTATDFGLSTMRAFLSTEDASCVDRRKTAPQARCAGFTHGRAVCGSFKTQTHTMVYGVKVTHDWQTVAFSHSFDYASR